MNKLRKFFTIREDNLWKEFCQRWADFHFYKSLLKKYSQEKRDLHLSSYFLWIDRKFMFDEEK